MAARKLTAVDDVVSNDLWSAKVGSLQHTPKNLKQDVSAIADALGIPPTWRDNARLVFLLNPGASFNPEKTVKEVLHKGAKSGMTLFTLVLDAVINKIEYDEHVRAEWLAKKRAEGHSLFHAIKDAKAVNLQKVVDAQNAQTSHPETDDRESDAQE